MMGLYEYSLTVCHTLNMCLPHANLVLLKPNLIVTVNLHAVCGYAATHMWLPYCILLFLLFHSATAMQLHHVMLLCQP